MTSESSASRIRAIALRICIASMFVSSVSGCGSGADPSRRNEVSRSGEPDGLVSDEVIDGVGSELRCWIAVFNDYTAEQNVSQQDLVSLGVPAAPITLFSTPLVALGAGARLTSPADLTWNADVMASRNDLLSKASLIQEAAGEAVYAATSREDGEYEAFFVVEWISDEHGWRLTREYVVADVVDCVEQP